jgi:hypothetical protein
MHKLFTTAVLLSAAPALAQVDGFTDRATFEAAAGALLSFESFEALPLDTSTAQQDEVVVDGFTLSAVNEGFTFLPPLSVQGVTSTGGAFATDGVQHINVGSLFNSGQNNDVVLTFAFNSPIDAFFVDLTDLGGLDSQADPRGIFEVAGETVTIYDASTRGGMLRTVGFILDTPVTSFDLRTTAGDSFGVDAVSFGLIPEPATAGLLGIAGLTLLRRRR